VLFIPLQNVATGAAWPDGRTVRTKAWAAADWDGDTTAAPVAQASLVTANGGNLTAAVPGTAGDLMMAVYIEESGVTAGSSPDDEFGCGVFAQVAALLDVNGDAVLIEWPHGSGVPLTVPEYLTASNGG